MMMYDQKEQHKRLFAQGALRAEHNTYLYDFPLFFLSFPRVVNGHLSEPLIFLTVSRFTD